VPSTPPLRVLIAGAGVAALETVLALRALAREKVQLDLLAPAGDYVQRQASVLSPFSGQAAPSVPLERLADAGVRLHRGALAAVDPEGHAVRTTDGGHLTYDRLVVAPGAHAIEGVPGAVTFRGPISAGAVEAAVRGAQNRVIFVLAPESSWPLPLYELALLTARERPDGPEIAIVSPEPRPLDVFGRTASDALARLLDRAGIGFVGDTRASEVCDGVLVTEDGRMLEADAVIALPRIAGRRIDGLPADADGFLEVDGHGRVRGVADVFAAGDVTAGPIKQGGLAAQQADAAAEWIAREAGASVTPEPARRILRGVVLTGEAPLYLRRDLDEDTEVTRALHDVPPGVSRAGLWWPSGKVAGRYLTGFLERGGLPADTLSDRPPRKPQIHV
jgi:sulfide:quinone oxidoreductase